VSSAGELSWSLSYRRKFGEVEMEEWKVLMSLLENVRLDDSRDMVCWKLERSGKFSTRSMYRFITFAGVIDVEMMEIWSAKIPLKVKIFLWMAWHDRIQTVQQLRRRNWDGACSCKFCDAEESVNHLLFQCPIAVATWCWVRDSLGWTRIPTSILSFQNLLSASGGVEGKMKLWWVMAAVGWALWKTRNDLIFSNIVIKSPKQVAYLALGFLKQWTVMEKKEGSKKEALVEHLKEGMARW
jgi:hypothetical protein